MKNIILLILFSLTVNSHAEEINYSMTYQECMAGAGGEHPSMIDCLDQERDRISTEIQIALESTQYDTFQLEISEELKKTNKSWGQYVNQSCSIYIHLGGQRAELLQKNCLVDATINRLKFIQGILAESRI